MAAGNTISLNERVVVGVHGLRRHAPPASTGGRDARPTVPFELRAAHDCRRGRRARPAAPIIAPFRRIADRGSNVPSFSSASARVGSSIQGSSFSRLRAPGAGWRRAHPLSPCAPAGSAWRRRLAPTPSPILLSSSVTPRFQRSRSFSTREGSSRRIRSSRRQTLWADGPHCRTRCGRRGISSRQRRLAADQPRAVANGCSPYATTLSTMAGRREPGHQPPLERRRERLELGVGHRVSTTSARRAAILRPVHLRDLLLERDHHVGGRRRRRIAHKSKILVT